MARKQARRRKQKRTLKIAFPRVPVRHIVTPLAAALVVFATYEISASLLDREIGSLEISGPFQRVTALSIEESISDELDAGFLGANLAEMRRRIESLAWIDKAAVARRWPDRITISVTEQVPAASWGESGLLNVRGELFVRDARHVPAELPRLSGPENRAPEVARRYLELRERLIPMGLDLRSIELDPRGAWQVGLTNGVEIRLGRRDVDARADLFIDVVADVITSRAAEIDYVDMRYSNGFTIGWKGGAEVPGEDGAEDEGESEMLALRGDEAG